MSRVRGLIRRRDERGAEAVAIMIVIPVMVVLVFALINIGMNMQARMVVQNIVRDAARGAAADGGNNNPRTNTIRKSWNTVALDRLYANGKCLPSACMAGQKPTVRCTPMTAAQAGDIITCTAHYPYKPINGALLNSPMGLGFGSIVSKPFDITESARAETGG